MSAEGRVELQKLNQAIGLLFFGLVFGFQLDLFDKNLFTPAVFICMPFGMGGTS